MDGLLCHCRVNPDGHEPGSVLDCEAPKITRGTYVTPHPSVLAADGSLPLGKLDARGTCPDCGKTGVQVRRIETRATGFDGCGSSWKPGAGPLLNVAPGMAPHKVKGKPCDGAGKPPTETHYTPGRELASWAHVNGSGAVA